MRRRGLSLGLKLTAAIVLLLAAGIGVSAFYGYRNLQDQAAEAVDNQRAAGHAAMARQSQLLVRNVTASSSVLLAGGDFRSLEEQVATILQENPNVDWLVVAANQGGTSQVVAASGGAPVSKGQALSDSLSPLLVAQPTSSAIREVGDASNEYLTIYGANVTVAMSDGGERGIGQVRLAHSSRELEEALAGQLESARRAARESARNQLIVAAGILILGVLLGGVQGLRISRPLLELNRQAGAIAAGDFDRRVDVRSRDEIGQLATSFNSMAESLGSVLAEMAAKASIERELELARSVQELMSPRPELHRVGRFGVAGRCELAESCGGDWWSYHLLPGDRLLLVVGDVTGHGMPAAMIAATARGAVEALATTATVEELTPAGVLDAIDRAIRDVGNQELLMTCFALVVDPDAGVVQFANAGHCFPYVLRPGDDGRLKRPGVLAVRGNPLGNETKVINSGERALQPGDVLVLTTDGLTDRIAADGERFGEKRLRRAMEKYPMGRDGGRVRELRDRIVDQVDSFGGDEPADDDMTLIVCQFEARESGEVAQGAA